MDNINLGAVEAPYQEFTYTIKPFGVMQVNYVTDNFVLFDVSAAGALEVNFGGAVNQTNFTAGVQYKLKDPVPQVTLLNSSDAPLTIHFALGTGEIRDNRLSASGTINVASIFNAGKIKEHIFPLNGLQDTSNIEVSIGGSRNIIQNIGSVDIKVGVIGSSAYFIVQPMGSFDMPFRGEISVWGSIGEGFVIGEFN